MYCYVLKSVFVAKNVAVQLNSYPWNYEHKRLSDFLCDCSQVLGECCTCVFAFTLSSQTVLTTLLINWPSATLQLYSHPKIMHPCSNELMTSPFVSNQDDKTESVQKQQAYLFKDHSGRVLLQDVTNISTQPTEIMVDQTKSSDPECTHFDQLSSQDSVPPFQTSWRTVNRPRTHPTPGISLLSGRGSYVLRLSPSCSLGALAVNCDQATDTELVFFSPLDDVEMGVRVYSSKVEGLSGRFVCMCVCTK